MKKHKKLIAAMVTVGLMTSAFSAQAASLTGDDLIKEIGKGYSKLETTVKVEDYTKYGVDFEGFQDAVIAASYQAPLSLGIESYKYSTDNVKYATASPYYLVSDRVQLKVNQSKLKKEVERITKSLIEKDMTEKQKHEAIYNYLVKKVKYDNAAYNNFKSGKVTSITEAHTAYGALVNYLAVCQGISAAYKALADQAGLESMVITGTYKGVNHAWNKVKINGKWSNIDATITNHLLFATDEKAASSNYKESLDYALDADIKAGKYSTSAKAVTATKPDTTATNKKPASGIEDVEKVASTSTTVEGWHLYTIDCLDKHAYNVLNRKPEQTEYEYSLFGKTTAEEYLKEFKVILKDVRGGDYFDNHKLEYSVSGNLLNIKIIKK